MTPFMCDICGKCYDYYGDGFTNTIAFISKDKDGRWSANESLFLDICPDCSRKIKREIMILFKKE